MTTDKPDRFAQMARTAWESCLRFQGFVLGGHREIWINMESPEEVIAKALREAAADAFEEAAEWNKMKAEKYLSHDATSAAGAFLNSRDYCWVKAAELLETKA